VTTVTESSLNWTVLSIPSRKDIVNSVSIGMPEMKRSTSAYKRRQLSSELAADQPFNGRELPLTIMSLDIAQASVRAHTHIHLDRPGHPDRVERGEGGMYYFVFYKGLQEATCPPDT
jgi:hypothetical protein